MQTHGYKISQNFINCSMRFVPTIIINIHLYHFQEYPIFWELVQMLLTKDFQEEHTTPIVDYCHMCDISYKNIIKYENLDTESQYLVNYLASDNYQDLNYQALLDTFHFQSSSLSDSELTRLYFQQLNDDEIEKLRKYYAKDFEVFGYDSYYY